MLDTMTQAEITDYIATHGDEFTVIRVESNLSSLPTADDFEKCFVAAAKKYFRNGVTDLSSAQQALYLVGFAVEINASSGKAHSMSEIDLSIDFVAWILIMAGVMALLFDGSITMRLKHNLTGEELGRTQGSESLAWIRGFNGIEKDQPIEPQLLKLFGIS